MLQVEEQAKVQLQTVRLQSSQAFQNVQALADQSLRRPLRRREGCFRAILFVNKEQMMTCNHRRWATVPELHVEGKVMATW